MMNTEKPKPRQWCLIGNVVKDQRGAPKPGTKTFAAGAKVYCLPAPWGDGYDQMTMIGHHQQANRLVALVGSGERIENWRAMPVYSAQVKHLLEQAASDTGRKLWRSRRDVETYIEAIKSYAAKRQEKGA